MAKLDFLREKSRLFCVKYFAWRYAKNFAAIQILGQFCTFEEILAVWEVHIAEKSALEA